MKPTLPDALRFASGSRLRVEIALKPLLREAAEKALARHSISLTAIEAAILIIQSNEPHMGELIGEIANGNANIFATRLDDGNYAFRIVATHADLERNIDAQNVMLQLIGKTDVYLSRATDQGPVAIAKLRYASDGRSVVVSLFTQAVAQRVPQALQSLMPAELVIATLSLENLV
jgi:hypothetical protein